MQYRDIHLATSFLPDIIDNSTTRTYESTHQVMWNGDLSWNASIWYGRTATRTTTSTSSSVWWASNWTTFCLQGFVNHLLSLDKISDNCHRANRFRGLVIDLHLRSAVSPDFLDGFTPSTNQGTDLDRFHLQHFEAVCSYPWRSPWFFGRKVRQPLG